MPREPWAPIIITDYTPGVSSGIADAADILRWPIYGYTNAPVQPRPEIKLSTSPIESNFREAAIAFYIGGVDETTPTRWSNQLPLLANPPILASTINWSEVVNYWEETQRWDTVYAIRYAIYHLRKTWADHPTIHVAGPNYSDPQWANPIHEQTREWFLWIAKRIIGQLTCPDMEPESRRRFTTNVEHYRHA